MITRRDFTKFTVATTVFPQIVSKSIADTKMLSVCPGDNFIKEFRKVGMESDLVRRWASNSNTFDFILNNFIPSKNEFKDDKLAYFVTDPKVCKAYAAKQIYLDLYTYKGNSKQDLLNNLNTNAVHCVVAAGTYRNIVVYDKQDKQGQFTTRLSHLMSRFMDNGHKSLTDIFLRKTDRLVKQTDGVRYHFLDDNQWQYVESYYKELGGTLAKDDKNLVIAISSLKDDLEKDLYHIVDKNAEYNWDSGNFETTGNFVVMNQSVLLGSF